MQPSDRAPESSFRQFYGAELYNLTWTLLAALAGHGELFGRGAGEHRTVQFGVQRAAVHRSVETLALVAVARAVTLAVVEPHPVEEAFLCFQTIIISFSFGLPPCTKNSLTSNNLAVKKPSASPVVYHLQFRVLRDLNFINYPLAAC